MSCLTPIWEPIEPKHIIILLHDEINDRECFEYLKKSFSMDSHPSQDDQTPLTDSDYTHMIQTANAKLIHFEGVECLLAVFTDLNVCLEFIKQKQVKRIFFVTNGPLGKRIVPLIMECCPRTFTNEYTNQPYRSIYLMCPDTELQQEWIGIYIDYIQILKSDLDIFANLSYDIGSYLTMEAKRLLLKSTNYYPLAEKHLESARKLFNRYKNVTHIELKNELINISALFELYIQNVEWNDSERPKHLIVWLDTFIGVPGNCQHLKYSFSTYLDPTNSDPTPLIDSDYDELNRAVGPGNIIFEGVWFLLAAFPNPESCIEFMKINRNKRIFFITSGSLGRITVPAIVSECPNLFRDPYTNEPHPSIYVYCHNIRQNMDWMLDFEEYVQAFNFDQELLLRMIRDVANYYFFESARLWKNSVNNFSCAANYLIWARELYDRYRRFELRSPKDELTEIYELFSKIVAYRNEIGTAN